MDLLERVGVITTSGAVMLALISGCLVYLANHGVQPVPDPSPSTSPKDPARNARLQRYNTRYIAMTRIVLTAAISIAAIGLLLLLIGALGN